MTATAAMIAEISPFTVDDETRFTKATFTRLSAVARAMLDAEDPGLVAALYDHAHALLICHLYDAGKEGKGAIKSESIGFYTYSKDAGATSYLLEYQSLIALGTGSANGKLEEQERTDHEMRDMQLDQGLIPRYSEDEEGLE